MTDNKLTEQESVLVREMIKQWAAYLPKNELLSQHYDGKVPINDMGISIPPPIARKLSRCSMMWSRQAVKRVADASVIEGFGFSGDAPAGFLEAMEQNAVIDKYDETLPSQLQHGPSFWTITAGDTGEPDFVISSYDALHATALYDYRHNRIMCGMSIVDVDRRHPEKPTAINFYAPDGSIVEYELVLGRWVSRRLNCGTGRCAMEMMRTEPDKKHPFGNSLITPAILSLEEEANRQAQRMVLHSELFTSPTRYILGANDDIFENGRWQAYLGSILALPAIDEEGENLPQTGQYAQASIQPHISYIRQLASQFAAEASIPIHSLLYTDANPASAEAINASRNDLIERVRKLNRINGQSLKNIALLAMSIQQEKPVSELGELEQSFSVQWRNPLTPSLASSADAAQKLAASVPGFAGTPTFWRMLGYTDRQIADIEAEIASNTLALPDLNA